MRSACRPAIRRGLTVTGGLPYHGGPGSGYLVHAIAKLADVLRADPGAYGAVSGVGMHMTKHVYGVYSTTPGALAPPDTAAVQRDLDANTPVPVVPEHAGDATVVAYSVVHGRDGSPESALLVCDVGGGARTYARLDGLPTRAGPRRSRSWSAGRSGSRRTRSPGRPGRSGSTPRASPDQDASSLTG